MQKNTMVRLQFPFISMEFGSLSSDEGFPHSISLGKSYVPKKVSLVRGNLKPQITGDTATKDLLETYPKLISNYHFLMLRIQSSESSPQIRFMENIF